MRFRRRLIFLYVVFCCLMGVIWLRATQLQWIDGDAWAQAASHLRQRPERLDALRGPIVSGDGVVLAEDRPAFQLAVVPWDWQRRARARCTGCGAIYHPSAARRADGTLRLAFPRTCACSRLATAGLAETSFPRTTPARDAAPHLERLPAAELRDLERALDVASGTLDKLARERVAEVDRLVAVMRRELESAGDDSSFLEKRLELREQDLLRRPFTILGRVPEGAARLLLTDEEGRYHGFEVQSALRRWYPLGDFAPQLLGFTSQLAPKEYTQLRAEHGDDVTFSTRVGRRGLERAFNWEMHGQPGHRVLELDEDGQFSQIVEERPPHPGKPLLLSLDAAVSRDAERLLFDDKGGPAGYVPQGPPSGAFVAIDAYTGEILIWAEGPRFDLNEGLDDLYDPKLSEAQVDATSGLWVPKHPLDPGMDLETWRAQLVQPAPLTLSRIGQLAVEPGSTFKPFIALGLLESGLPLPFAHYVCSGGHHPSPGCHGCGAVDLVLALAHSCNRYFAYSVRDSRGWPTYRVFLGGFLHELGIGLPPTSEVAEWSAGQWLWPWIDFPMSAAVDAAGKVLQEEAGREAPELSLRLAPGCPPTFGGDPGRLGRRIAKVARWLAARTGERKVEVGVERVADVDQEIEIQVGLRALTDGRWHQLPGAAAEELPPCLAGFAPGHAGITGHLERGGTAWFRVRVERRVGRTDPASPPVIRPEDGRNVAIGQGPVLVTPLQMVRAAAVLANGGLLVDPHVVRAVGGREQPVHARRLAIDPRHLETVRDGMFRVVNTADGTAHRTHWGRVPATVYGKTGTAQVGSSWKPFGDTEQGGPWHHWFVGFAEAPGCRTIAFACVLHSRSEAAAGLTAAPETAGILERWYASPSSRAVGR